MPSCTCCIPAFSPAPCAPCGYEVDREPFAGLMTQGMVVHETFQGPDGGWLYPEEVDVSDAAVSRVSDGAAVTRGRLEKMSKSKKNVVGLESMIDAYGADTVRLLLLSDSPPERDLEWTEAGIEGAWRYVNRVWRLVMEPTVALPPAGAAAPAAFAAAAAALRTATHKTIQAVGEDFEQFRFNRAVARVRELSNAVADLSGSGDDVAWALREALETLVILVGPMMPHLGEELWRALGHDGLLVDAAWPDQDPALLIEDSVTVAVQVNGKLRATISLPRDANEATARELALADNAVQRTIADKPVRKVIVVPNRIVNVVA